MIPEARRAPLRSRAIHLPERAEPLRLHANLQQLAAEDPVRAREEAPRRLAASYLRAWGAALSDAGVPPGAFRAVVAGTAREVWLWVMGDRPFVQLDATIRGRTARRAEFGLGARRSAAR